MNGDAVEAVRKRAAELRADVQSAKQRDRVSVAVMSDSLASTADMLEELATENDVLRSVNENSAVVIAGLRKTCERMQLAVDAKDAIVAAGQRTIESGNEAFRTLREQWQAERDRLRAEVERLLVVATDIESQRHAVAVERNDLITECDAMRPVVEAACALYDFWCDPKADDYSSKDLDDAIEAYRSNKDSNA